MRMLIQSTIGRYMDIMGPKLHQLVEQIVSRQTVDKSADQVHFRCLVVWLFGLSSCLVAFACSCIRCTRA